MLWDPSLAPPPRPHPIVLKPEAGGSVRYRLDGIGLIQLLVSTPNTRELTWMASRIACQSPADARRWGHSDIESEHLLLTVARLARRLFSFFVRRMSVMKHEHLPATAGSVEFIAAGYRVQ
jgi:hypothetical protein